jgi:hypothetical protein
MKHYRSVVAIEPQHVDDGYWTHTERGMTIYEADTAPRDTGLLDARGNKIMSIIESAPIGFNRS